MSVFGLLVLLTAAPSAPLVTSVEKLAVRRDPSANPVLQVNPFTATLTVRGVSSISASTLCPQKKVSRGTITLTCSTRRLWARLDDGVLEIRQTRGLPPTAAEDAVPLRGFPPDALLLPESCPGTLPAVQGECSLGVEPRATVEALYAQALFGGDVGLAHLRLGDLAMEAGESQRALSHFEHADGSGVVGRLGRARLCDVTGACFDSAGLNALGNSDDMPAPIARDQRLRAIRRALFAERVGDALQLFSEAAMASPELCDGAIGFCQQVAIAGLLTPDAQTRGWALSALLTDRFRQGPHTLALARAAADAAESLGACRFAAGLMADASRSAPVEELDDHLSRTAWLYVKAGDRVRGSVIAEFAASRKKSGSADWKRLEAALKSVATPAAPKVGPRVPVTVDGSVDQDLAAAALARSRSRW